VDLPDRRGIEAVTGVLMDDLATFLRARLDEDEALAREAPDGPWHIGNAVDPTKTCNVHTFPGARLVADGLNWLVAEHIARHNPARVLAEVEAKRRMVNRITYHADLMGWDEVHGDLLRSLASVYAEHPQYKENWRP
jgi:hypothetical protein